MKPMNWLLLMIFFFTIFMILQTSIFFNFKKYLTPHPFYKLHYNKFSTKW